jgi:8-oxo-dGTP pyrophosphatase MutT (NUDIX family)
MIDEIANGSKSDAKDLLLEEYRNLADCFWKNEQSGETRVNLFIGLVSAAVGGLVTLASAQHGPRGEPLRMVITTSLSVLVVLGIVTLFRMLTRNEATDRYKRGAAAVRQVFRDHFDSAHILLHYYPFAAAKQKNKRAIAIRKVGGLTHTVAVVNSILVAGFAGAVVYPESRLNTPVGSLAWTYACSAGVFCLAVILQFAYVNKRERLAKTQDREGEASHAGGIVHRLEDDTVRYLLVGPKKDVKGEWLLPKGHIEDGEGHGEAALREVREETGVVAQLVCFVGRAEFDAPKETVRAKYYLMKALFDTNSIEKRRMGWFNFPEAKGLLTHATDKHLLQIAEKERAERVNHTFRS